jgi:5-methylcytosine-specific restriction endonuclease McrA
MKRTPLKRISAKQMQRNAHLKRRRDYLLEKCHGRCMMCGEIGGWLGLSLHHKTFRSQMGDDSDDNLILICHKCHSACHGIKIEEGNNGQTKEREE